MQENKKYIYFYRIFMNLTAFFWIINIIYYLSSNLSKAERVYYFSCIIYPILFILISFIKINNKTQLILALLFLFLHFNIFIYMLLPFKDIISYFAFISIFLLISIVSKFIKSNYHKVKLIPYLLVIIIIMELSTETSFIQSIIIVLNFLSLLFIFYIYKQIKKG